MGYGKKENNKRSYPGLNCGRTAHKVVSRRICATERQQAWDLLSPEEQLKELDRRLGVNLGAVKQRARLQRAISGIADLPPELQKLAADNAAGIAMTAAQKAQKRATVDAAKQAVRTHGYANK